VNMKPIIYVALLVLVAVLSGIALGAFLKEFNLLKEACVSDADCDWVITNCCPEVAGAYWECVNLRTWEAPTCPPDVICPQVLSPKPEKPCRCEAGKCEA